MKRNLLFALTILLANTLFSQWTDRNITGPSNLLYELRFIDNSTGFAASGESATPPANEGYVYKTTDGGLNWNISLTVGNASESGHVQDVQLLSATTIYAYGNKGNYPLIAKSLNGGSTWDTTAYSNYTGGLIGTNLKCGYFLTTSKGYVGGLSGLWETLNGGVSWTNKFIANIYKIRFVNSSVGFARADTVLYKTIDGGSTWNSIYNSSYQLNDFEAIDANNIFITSQDPSNFLYKSTNGGGAWSSVAVPAAVAGVFSVGFISPNVGVLAGRDAGVGFPPIPKGVIYSTLNGGVSWTLEHSYFGTGATGYFKTHVNPMGSVFSNCFAMCYSDNLNLLTDIVEKSKADQVSVSPNPTNGQLYINSEDKITNVSVYDLTGKLMTTVTTNLNNINISEWPSGIYFARVTTENGVVTKKIVKQ